MVYQVDGRKRLLEFKMGDILGESKKKRQFREQKIYKIQHRRTALKFVRTENTDWPKI
ncbi:MAG: hypothetical protein CM15mV112_180 [uncultured marine virus]|nr:MAG: hypothetical protein CM15mV112_180 [uncultured marine virus]